jgi:multidrug efflux pump subunit AcrA (membrane-fusion protein)
VHAAARVAEHWVNLELLDLGAQVRSGRAGTDVLFAVPDAGALALGRAVDVKITLPPREGLIEVPLQGVYADRMVYTIENQVLRAVDVERVGVREDAEGNMSVLVHSDELSVGMPIVVSSLSRAGSGSRVEVINGDGATGLATR